MVDDSEIVIAVTKTALEAAGYVVITHNRPAGCVAMILHEKPDLLLIDVNMPRLGGDTVVKLFGKAKPNSDTIVLLYSSLPVEALRAKAADSGAHGFIHKTDDTFELVRQVNRWFKQGKQSSSGHMRAALPVQPDDSPQARASGTRPVAPAADSQANPVASSGIDRRPSGTTRLDHPTVLFVDDDMLTLSGYRREVQSEGVQIEFALSGAQALRRILSSTPPALVVSDLVMPEPDGPEVYRQAVAADRSWEERFVFVTGASGIPNMARFLSSHSGPVLYKPVQGEQLRSAIRQALVRSRLVGGMKHAAR